MGKQRSKSARSGFLQIVSGTLLGQVVTLLVLPIMSRLYNPGQFGFLTLLSSISALLAPLFILGMEQSVVRPKNDKSARRMASLGISSLLIGSAVVALILAVWSWPATRLEVNPRSLMIFLPLGCIVFGLALLFNQLLVREEKYATLAVRNTIQSLAITAVQLLCAFAGGLWGEFGLVIGFVVGTLFGAATLLPSIWRYLQPVSVGELFTTLKAEWRFPVVFAPSIALAQLAQQFPLLFLAGHFGVHAAGQVGMADRIIAVPTVLVGLAGSSVFIGNLSNALRAETGNALEIYKRFALKLSILGLLAFLGCVFVAPPLIPILLGVEWEDAAMMVRIMAGVCFGRIMATPLRGAFSVLGEARLVGMFEVLRVCALMLTGLTVIFIELDFFASALVIYTAVAILDFLLAALGFYMVKKRDRLAR